MSVIILYTFRVALCCVMITLFVFFFALQCVLGMLRSSQGLYDL
jgi:hypothetical protein